VRLVRACHRLLGMVTFYTVANNKLRAWSIPAGSPAPAAAGYVHSTMEEGFIKAEVVACDELIAEGSLAGLQSKGKLRVEGRDYQVEDGDLVQFFFRGQ